MKQIKTLEKTKLFLISGILASSMIIGCDSGSKSEDDDTGLLVTLLALDNQAKAAAAAEAAKQCEFSYNTEGESHQEVCKPRAAITNQAHYRIEDLAIDTNNSYFFLNIGFDVTPANLPSNAAGSGRFTFFHGPSASTTPSGNPISQVRFNGHFCGEANNCQASVGGFGTAIANWELSTVTTGSPALPNNFGPSTICFDLKDNGESQSARITVWATGKNGADCKNISSLTKANALFNKEDWTTPARVSLDQNTFIRFSNQSAITKSRVVVRSETAIKD